MMNDSNRTLLKPLLSLSFLFFCVLVWTQAGVLHADPDQASAGWQLYWSDKEWGEVWHANLDGSAAQQLPDSFGRPEALAINYVRHELYLVEDEYGILKSDLTGSDWQTLVAGYPLLSKPSTLAPHLGDGTLYWTDSQRPAIGRYDLESGQTVFQLPLGPDEANGLAIDEERGRVYWSRNGYLYRSKLDGSDTELLPDLFAVGDVALDTDADKIYYTETLFDFYGYSVKRANGDGSAVETVVSFGMGRSDGVALDIEGGKVYWSERGKQPRIWRANLDGTEQEVILDEGVFGPFGLALDAAAGKLYWADWVSQKIQRANLDGSSVEDLLRTIPARPRYVALDEEAGLLYWTGDRGAAVSQVRLDGSGSGPLIPNGESSLTGGIALHKGHGRLYWSDGVHEAVYRAKTDGTAVQPIIYRRLDDPQGLALDEAAGKMVWADRGRKQILRANLDGSQVEILLQQGLDTPTSLALDLLRGKMVWTEPFLQEINQANLDGSGFETLLSAADGLVRPNLVALDVSAGKIYWSDYGRRSIRRADRDGSHIEDLVTSGIQVPSGLVLGMPPPEIHHSYMPAVAN